jgi:spore germination cell wall hydrolase CwlJ-like protein
LKLGPVARAHTALIAGLAVLGTVLLCATPAAAFKLDFDVLPATFSPAIAKVRAETPPVDAPPALTEDLLQAYVDRQQALKAFDGFEVAPTEKITEEVLLGYIARQRNEALEAIGIQTDQPRLTASIVEAYAADKYVPTVKRLRHSQDEVLCLAQAIYHEARGESEAGQVAVINVIVNRAMSKRYPNTLCGVIFQNADNGRYRCQFTFACDGRSDMGRERKAWTRSVKMAEAAYREFAKGKRPGVLPNTAMYYHTTAVAPKWSHTFRRVAAIGSHVFYSPL